MFLPKSTYLGHIDINERRSDPTKADVIWNMIHPTNIATLHAFLGELLSKLHFKHLWIQNTN